MNDIELKAKLGLKVKQYRKQLNLTQEKFAEKIDISQRQVSFIEIGRCFPSPETLVKISNIFKCTVKDLFDFESVEDIKIIKNELRNMINKYSEDKLKILYVFGKNI